MCWLCTSSYRRALVKARQVEKEGRFSSKKRPHQNHEKSQKNNDGGHTKKIQKTDNDREHRKQQSMNMIDIPDIPEKVARIPNSGIKIIDTNSSDHVIAMTELKETIASLQRKVGQKDRELLDKDKFVSYINVIIFSKFQIHIHLFLKITELKAKQFTLENELRNKMKDSDRLNEGKIEILNKKVSSLLKEVATLSRNTKRADKVTANAAAAAEKASALAKDSGGSGTDSPSTN